MERNELEKKYGKNNVFDTKQLQENFQVLSFLAPYVEVIRISDGKKGMLMFQHKPRYYFDFK